MKRNLVITLLLVLMSVFFAAPQALAVNAWIGPTFTDPVNGLDFNDNGGSADTIDRNDGGNFVSAGFKKGQLLEVKGTASNNGRYKIVSVATTVITLSSGDFSATETADLDASITVVIDGLIAAWKFENNATDSSTNGQDLIPTSIQYGSDQVLQGSYHVIFDDTNRYFVRSNANLSSDFPGKVSSDLTVLFRYKPASTGYQELINMYNGPATTTGQSWTVFVGGDSKIHFKVASAHPNPDSGLDAISVLPIEVGHFYHVACTFSNKTRLQTIRVYEMTPTETWGYMRDLAAITTVDTSEAYASNDMRAATTNFVIGDTSDLASSDEAHGVIDEVVIFNRVLTQYEITRIRGKRRSGQDASQDGVFGASDEVPIWGTFEKRLVSTTSLTDQQKYSSVTLSATFTAPSSNTITVNGFWDGGNDWKIRFMPDEVGTWTYTITSSDPYLNHAGYEGDFYANDLSNFDMSADLNQVYKGRISVKASGTNAGRTFVFPDGSPFRWVGGTWWGMNSYKTPYALHPGFSDSGRTCYECNIKDHFKRGVRENAADGLTIMQLIGASHNDAWDSSFLGGEWVEVVTKNESHVKLGYGFDGEYTVDPDCTGEGGDNKCPGQKSEAGGAFNHTDADGTGTGWTKLVPNRYQLLDKRMEYLREHGIVPVMFFHWGNAINDRYNHTSHNSSSDDDGYEGFSQTELENYWKYLVARYGAYNIILVGAGEYPYVTLYYASPNSSGWCDNDEASCPSCGDPTGDIRLYADVADTLHTSYDGWNHLFSMHPTSAETYSCQDYSSSAGSTYDVASDMANDYFNADWFDFSMIQLQTSSPYTDWSALITEIGEDRGIAGGPKPVVHSEGNYEDCDNQSNPCSPTTNQNSKAPVRDAWVALFNGAAGYTFGQRGLIYSNTGNWASPAGNTNPDFEDSWNFPGQVAMSYLTTYFNMVDWNTMVDMPTCGSAPCTTQGYGLVTGSKQYLVYNLNNSTDPTVQMQNGKYCYRMLKTINPSNYSDPPEWKDFGGGVYESCWTESEGSQTFDPGTWTDYAIIIYPQEYYVRPDADCTYNGDGTAYACAAGTGLQGAWKGFANIQWDAVRTSKQLWVAGTFRESLDVLASGDSTEDLKITSCSATNGCGQDNPAYIYESKYFANSSWQLWWDDTNDNDSCESGEICIYRITDGTFPEYIGGASRSTDGGTTYWRSPKRLKGEMTLKNVAWIKANLDDLQLYYNATDDGGDYLYVRCDFATCGASVVGSPDTAPAAFGVWEIPIRDYGILLYNKEYVEFDGLTVAFGQGGEHYGVGVVAWGEYPFIARNITFKNMLFEHFDRWGVLFYYGHTANLLFENNTFNDIAGGVHTGGMGFMHIHGSHTSSNTSFIGNRFLNGAIRNDDGDVEMIGLQGTDGVVIQGNYFGEHGWDGMDTETELEQPIQVVVWMCANIDVSENYFYRGQAGAFRTGTSSDNLASYNVKVENNIFDNWGWGTPSDIYGVNINATHISGGNFADYCTSDSDIDCSDDSGYLRVWNNLYVNGPDIQAKANPSETDSTLVTQSSYYTEYDIRNNIFHNGNSYHEFYFHLFQYGSDGISHGTLKANVHVTNNVFYQTAGVNEILCWRACNWSYKTYDWNEIVGSSPGYFTYDMENQYGYPAMTGNITVNPLLQSTTAGPTNLKMLTSASGARGTGYVTGSSTQIDPATANTDFTADPPLVGTLTPASPPDMGPYKFICGLGTPSLTSPTQGQTGVPIDKTFTSSAYSIHSDCTGDTHVGSDWEVCNNPDCTDVYSSAYDDMVNLLSWPISVEMQALTTYYARVRHYNNGEDSPWSTIISFVAGGSPDPGEGGVVDFDPAGKGGLVLDPAGKGGFVIVP